MLSLHTNTASVTANVFLAWTCRWREKQTLVLFCFLFFVFKLHEKTLPQRAGIKCEGHKEWLSQGHKQNLPFVQTQVELVSSSTTIITKFPRFFLLSWKPCTLRVLNVAYKCLNECFQRQHINLKSCVQSYCSTQQSWQKNGHSTCFQICTQAHGKNAACAAKVVWPSFCQTWCKFLRHYRNLRRMVLLSNYNQLSNYNPVIK